MHRNRIRAFLRLLKISCLIAASMAAMSGAAFSQGNRDTVWVGYDRGKADSLITYDGRYIGTAYAHQAAGWQYALKMDLTLFGTNVQTNNFEPLEMSFSVIPSKSLAGAKNRTMTAHVWEDSSGVPGKALASIPFTMIHTTSGAETLIVIDLRPFRASLARKNPIWIGFEEGPSTDGELFTWMRSSYSPNTSTNSYDRRQGGRWGPITQPAYWETELRPGYNLLFRVRYAGDKRLAVRTPGATVPAEIALAPNAPNPFSAQTVIPYYVGGGVRRATIEIFDAAGRKIATLYDGMPAPGWNKAHFVSANLPPGLYRCVLAAGTARTARSMLLVR